MSTTTTTNTRALPLVAKFNKFKMFAVWFTDRLVESNLLQASQKSEVYSLMGVGNSLESQLAFYTKHETECKEIEKLVKQMESPPKKSKSTKKTKQQDKIVTEVLECIAEPRLDEITAATSTTTAPDYNLLTVDDLKSVLKQMNLSTKGKKSELIDRILNANSSESEPQQSVQVPPEEEESNPTTVAAKPSKKTNPQKKQKDKKNETATESPVEAPVESPKKVEKKQKKGEDEKNEEKENNLENNSFETMKVDDLKKLLKERNLSTKGKKEELVSRLLSTDQPPPVVDDAETVEVALATTATTGTEEHQSKENDDNDSIVSADIEAEVIEYHGQEYLKDDNNGIYSMDTQEYIGKFVNDKIEFF